MRISKKQLAHLFGFYNRRTGLTYSWRLREYVFTDTVLQELNLSEEEYRKRKIFDVPTTRRILEYFSIDPKSVPAV